MNNVILKEYNNFKKHHTNIYNILSHFICGILYMLFLLLLFNENAILVLVLYSILIVLTLKSLSIGILIFIILSILIIFFSNKLETSNIKIILFIIFYLLPDLSHYMTNETTILNFNNITPQSIFINIFYLLPFTIKILLNIK